MANAHLSPLRLKRMQIQGFRSLRDCSLELGDRTILIGANGSGKSNLLGVFRMMNAIVEGGLASYVNKSGKADSVLFRGVATTPQMNISLGFEQGLYYQAVLCPTDDFRLYFEHEVITWRNSETRQSGQPARSAQFRQGRDESLLAEVADDAASGPVPDIDCWRIYHVHDTHARSALKKPQNPADDEYLRSDGENLVPFLRRLRDQHPKHYEQIRFAVSLAMPTFGDFIFKESEGTLTLRWHEKGSDYPLAAHQVSDGTLRFMCLATLLLQPVELQPSLIIIDEPELGLHPAAIHLLAEMIQSASVHRQVLVATQSPALVDAFAPEDIAVVERGDEGTTITRPDPQRLKAWLADYTLGQVWNMNVMGGQP